MATTQNTMASRNIVPPRKFGPQYWVEGRKWGDRSTPCRLYPKQEEEAVVRLWDESSYDTDGSYDERPVLPRRDGLFEPEPTWQHFFYNLHDLVTGTTTEDRGEVTFEKVGALIHALNPPKPLPPPIVYKEPALSEYELLRKAELEAAKEELKALRESQHDNRKKLKELTAKQDAVALALQKKETDWETEQARQKSVYRPRYLAAVSPAKKPQFREEKELEDLIAQLTQLRRLMGDYDTKVSRLKAEIMKGEEFMKQAEEGLEILREYRKFDESMVGGYISY
jgi:hypothetical protein